MSQMEARTIDGEEYEFASMGAKESVRILTKLFKLMGKPLMMGFGSYSGKDQPMNKIILAEAIGVLTEKMDEGEVLDIIEKLCATNLLCNGKKVIFNAHYECRIGHMFKVLYAALEVQYGNFLDALPVHLNISEMAKKATTQASATSTGDSGAQS